MVGADRIAILLGALGLDAILGDPDAIWRRVPHPVGWMGAAIAWADRRLNREADGTTRRRLAGAVALVLVVGISAGTAALVETGLGRLPGGALLLALVASVLLAGNSLARHVARVRTALATGTHADARAAVAMIVGRDPSRLDRAGIARAAIETLAENFSDGVVAPAFWFALGGLPGLAAYKAVNTADSMIGHLSDRHRAFGWAAARLDDGLNLVPARLSALLIGLGAPLVGGFGSVALRVAWRDAGLHRSPNAGWPEAAMAGGLGLALGGPRIYAAGPVDEPMLNGTGRRDADAGDIDRSLRVYGAASLLHAALYGAVWLMLR